ncbi:hypothetical protein LUZ60_003562 [Juncus effusus]|nr:hypothetical protein LUZ60_003562 [Juncus effusus]
MPVFQLIPPLDLGPALYSIDCSFCREHVFDHKFPMLDDKPYHNSCFEMLYDPICDVCNSIIPENKKGSIEYITHGFWMQQYCASHKQDGTPSCCSCGRMEPMDMKYKTLHDGRKLCLECVKSSIMDHGGGRSLNSDIQEFYKELNMKFAQQIPFLLVNREVIVREPVNGPGDKIVEIVRRPQRLVRGCEDATIFLLFGLPRLLTGSLLAHEMMHAWLRLEGYRSLSPVVEEGICQVLAYMWLELESKKTSGVATNTNIKQGVCRPDFDKKLGEFFKYQIESDSSSTSGDGFWLGIKAVDKYGLRATLDHIKLTGSFPY